MHILIEKLSPCLNEKVVEEKGKGGKLGGWRGADVLLFSFVYGIYFILGFLYYFCY
jgi:hypothetical protein